MAYENIEQSFENLIAEIKTRITTENQLKDAKEHSEKWVNSKRKFENVKNCEDLYNLLKYRGLFGPYKINTLKMFQKLLTHDDQIYELVENYESKVRDQQNSVPALVNQYAIKRQKRDEERQRLERLRAQEQKTQEPTISSVPAPSPSSSFLEDNKQEIVNILKMGITIANFHSFARFLTVNSQDVQELQRAHKLLPQQTGALVHLYIRKINNPVKLLNALRQINRIDLVKKIEELMR